MKFPVVWGKSLQIRAKHTIEISSENPKQKKIQAFLFLTLG